MIGGRISNMLHHLLLALAICNNVLAFTPSQHYIRSNNLYNAFTSSKHHTILHAKTKKKKTIKSKTGGGGFGSKPDSNNTPTSTISADKNGLESQWDNFARITNLEVTPPGNPDDDDYEHFIVADVYVRVAPADDKPVGTGWYQTGKIVAAGDDADIRQSMTMQRGLIFWTSVHMWPQLAAQGKDSAKNLELGFMPPTLNMADETDGALDEEEAEDVTISQRAPVRGVSTKDVGFRPDFNPPGFTYKRREKAAMKEKKSALEEISDAS